MPRDSADHWGLGSQTRRGVEIETEQLVAIAMGVLDSAVPFCFFFNIDVPEFYAATLVLKVGIAFFAGAANWALLPYNAYFLITLCFGVFISPFTGLGFSPTSGVQFLGFVGHLMVTTCALRPQRYPTYFRVFAGVILASTVLFLVEWRQGHLTELFGRYMYFNDAQPNLGGEIAVAGMAAACLSGGPVYMVAYTLLSLFASYLLESRAAMLAGTGIFFVFLYFRIFAHRSPWIKAALVLLAIAVIGLILYDSASFLTSDVLMLDDENRGLGTGIVGRQDVWLLALQDFLRYPLFGVGYDYYHVFRPDDSPHGLFFNVISQLGLVGVLFLVFVGARIVATWRTSPPVALIMLMLLFLGLFSDRFLNINPFPFILFVLLFLAASSWQSAAEMNDRRPSLIVKRRSAVDAPKTAPRA